MNNKVLLAIVGLLVLGVGGYFVVSRNSGNSAPSTSNQGTTQPASPANLLKNLLTGGVSQSCTFSNTKDGATSDGVIYVASGKVRGDFNSVSGGKTTKTHMVVDGKTSYIWMDGQATGFKTTFDTSTTASPSGSASGGTSGSFDANANLNYNCKPWIVDNSMFSVPTNVQFMGLDSMMKATPNIPAVPTTIPY